MKLEWIWSEHLCYSLILEWPQGSLRDSEWSLRSLQNEWITQIFTPKTLISLFSKIHSLKSEHIHSFLFRDHSCDKEERKEKTSKLSRYLHCHFISNWRYISTLELKSYISILLSSTYEISLSLRTAIILSIFCLYKMLLSQDLEKHSL